MRLDGDVQSRTGLYRGSSGVGATLKRPARAKSLLVDYSKTKASPEELKQLDELLPRRDSALQSGPTTAKSLGCAASDSLSLASLVREGGNNQRRKSGPVSEQPMDSGNASFCLPDLDPMTQKSSHLLDASAETLEMEGQDSFCEAESGMDQSAHTEAPHVRNVHRRGLLASMRLNQSMSNLNSSLSPIKHNKGNLLSFSLRRRSGLGRSKTMNNKNDIIDEDAAVVRFHQSLSQIKWDDLDATDHTRNSHKSLHHQSRRNLLVRHSSVSALETDQPYSTLDLRSPKTSLDTRRASLQKVFSSPMKGSNPSPRSIATDLMPNSVEIRSGGGRRSSTVGRHSSLGNTSAHSLGRVSLRGNIPRGSSERFSPVSHPSNRSADRRRHGRIIPNLANVDGDDRATDDSLMSASTHSYFIGGGRGPPPTRTLTKAGGTHTSGPSSSRRSLMSASARTSSRRDLMQRQMSSRRNLGGGNDLLDDSSHFVTGSRIRRGNACHLLA